MGIQWNRSTPAFHIWVWASRWLSKSDWEPAYIDCLSFPVAEVSLWKPILWQLHQALEEVELCRPVVLSEAGESVDFQGIFENGTLPLSQRKNQVSLPDLSVCLRLIGNIHLSSCLLSPYISDLSKP